ncbi:MAG TPA: hypothetical protein VEU73_07570 [Gemmatimonadales bacterium]|nr:hypothetical protein [Gemmatimonadales bacterium]
MNGRLFLGTAAGCLLLACTSESRSPTQAASPTDPASFQLQHPGTHIMLPRGRVRPAGPGAAAPAADNGISYHGGPIILAQKVAAIYWSSSTIYPGGPAPGTSGAGSADGSLVGFFMSHLGGSPYYNINTTYYDGTGAPAQNSVTYTQFWASNTNVPLPGMVVPDQLIQAQVVSGFTSGQLTYDPNTLYLVFTDQLVNLGGEFGVVYCAYHGNFTWNGNDVKYAAMPHDIDFPDCNALNGSPNNDPAADAEVNTLAHETEETNTDEDLNAWYDSSGNENADKCAWTFGATYQTANGSTANMSLGSKDFLVQQNWVNANGGSCRLSW